MSLNIKNERVHALAREAAAITGRTQTGAIEEALRRLLEDYGADPAQARRDRKIADVLRIVAEYASLPVVEVSVGDSVRHVEDLYDDEMGLPR